MNEANVLSQLAMVESMSQARQSNIDAITANVAAFRPEQQGFQSKVHSYLTVYLAFLAQLVEKEIARQLTFLHKPTEDPGKGQLETNANSLGTMEGLNCLGLISAELIAYTQSALCKISLLTFAGGHLEGMRFCTKDLNGEYNANLINSFSSVITSVQLDCKKCLRTSEYYYKQCEKRFEEIDWATRKAKTKIEPTAIWHSAAEMTVSPALRRLAWVINQPFSDSKMFDEDPEPQIRGVEIMIARSLAAGNAANTIDSFIKGLDVDWRVTVA